MTIGALNHRRVSDIERPADLLAVSEGARSRDQLPTDVLLVESLLTECKQLFEAAEVDPLRNHSTHLVLTLN